MKSYIIGIAGELNSGKDTLASMINYIVHMGTTKANYIEWVTHKVRYDTMLHDRITHFADPMKDCLSIMYNIPRKHFDDRKYKDEVWYSIEEKRFLTEEQSISNKYYQIVIEDINYKHGNTLNDILNHYKVNIGDVTCIIKIRTLMQYFGTEIGRNLMGNDLWINATMGRAANIAETRGLCIIPDVRFDNEMNAIYGNSLYGQDVHIKRNSANNLDHASETIDFKCSNIINNNSTKLQLFYKAIALVNDMINS